MAEKSMAIPQLPHVKIIRDSIHGYIQLTMLEHKLIQLPALNRLHNIKQLGTAYLIYPGAKASRFEHSLGVMHIASRMIYQVLRSTTPEELKELFNLNAGSRKRFENDCCQLIQKVRLAALLHDVGHGPYSHATEHILLKALDGQELDNASKLFNCEKEDIPIHEYFSYKMITSDQSEIKNIIDSSSEIKAEEVAGLLIGRKSSSISDEGVGVTKKLISSQLDADRMDYLLRDAYATGVPFGLTDIDRVIMNLCLRKDKQGKYELAVHERALMSIEDIMDARFKMYKWVYNHHLKVALDELLITALDSMIDDKELSYQDFHWNDFLKGKTDDSYIHTKLIEYQKIQFKGLIDRRYAPTSLLKRPGDYYNFVKMIEKEMGRRISEVAIKNRINKWFAKIEKGKVEVEIPEELTEKLEKMKLLTIHMPRSPYKELNEKENIWICGDKGEELKELTTQSPYVEAINKEWQRFPSFYISFVVPGIKKDETKEYKDKILELVAREIAVI